MTDTTYVLRHGPTEYSRAYRVNGDPATPVPLAADGPQLCASAASALPIRSFATCVVTRLPRTAETARLLLAGASIPTTVEPLLDEIGYGDFEGGPWLAYGDWLRENGPWAVPPGGDESQRDALLRMFRGLRAVLLTPGPRLVVGHGLLVSVLAWMREHPGTPLDDAFFPEGAYLTPLVFTDAELTALLDEQVTALELAAPAR